MRLMNTHSLPTEPRIGMTVETYRGIGWIESLRIRGESIIALVILPGGGTTQLYGPRPS